jgi:hypothetical protein
MMKQWFEEIFLRPYRSLFSGLEIMTQNISGILKINTGISRSVHSLSRPILCDRSASSAPPSPALLRPANGNERRQDGKNSNRGLPQR